MLPKPFIEHFTSKSCGFLGYVSGENIIINGYVKNFSKVTIRHTKIVLLETIQYLSRGKIIQTEKRELAQIKFPKIRPGGRDEFVNKKLYVPPLPPTNIRNSNIIRLNYDIYVSVSSKLQFVSRKSSHPSSGHEK